MATDLSDFERSILLDMANKYPDFADALFTQIECVRVNIRENSGCGFFVHLQVIGNVERVSLKIMNGASASILGLKNPVVAVLFFAEGIMAMLEIATVEESSFGIDLTKLPPKVN